MADLAKIKKLIEDNAIGFATVGKSGKPHCIAVGFAKVISKNQLAITNNCMVESVKNLKENPNVALSVWAKNWKENCVGFELKGKAKYFTKGKWKEFVESMPENKGEKPKGAIIVNVSKIKSLA